MNSDVDLKLASPRENISFIAAKRDFRLMISPEFAHWPALKMQSTSQLFDTLLEQGTIVPGGLTEHRLLEGPQWPRTVRIRPASHGGWLARWTGDRFLRPDRVFRELSLVAALQTHGIPVAAPVFAAARRHGIFWRCAYASINEPDAIDGLALLRPDHDQKKPSPPRDDSRKSNNASADRRLYPAARVLGSALRQLHDAGVLHGDLQLRNVLFSIHKESKKLQCRFIDFDRAQIPSRLSPEHRMNECMRLLRSTRKNGLEISLRTVAVAFATYCAGDRDLRRAMQARRAPELRRMTRHRIGWRIGSILGKPMMRGGILVPLLALGVSVFGLGCDTARNESIAPIETPRLSMLAVGDTGRTRILPSLFEGQRSVSEAMTDEARRDSVDALVFLGDNFYWDGLSNSTLVSRIRENLVTPYCYFLSLDGPRSQEVRDACSTPLDERSPTPFFAVLGNHDLELSESASLQRNAIPDFVPGWQMSKGLAQAVELGNGVSLILFESEPSIDDRETLISELRTAIRAAKGPWRILAMHRPIATDDHGTPWLGGYPTFVRDAIEAEGKPIQLVLAAHHHSLQAFEVGPPIPSLQLGLGSGARAEEPLASADHPDVRFSQKVLGFARIDLVGHNENERLVATLFEAPSLPIIERLTGSRAVARFEVDAAGAVSASPSPRAASLALAP